MRAVFFGLFLLVAGCGDSVTDKKMDAINAKLDAIERRLYQNTLDVEKDIEAVQRDVTDLQCPH